MELEFCGRHPIVRGDVSWLRRSRGFMYFDLFLVPKATRFKIAIFVT